MADKNTSKQKIVYETPEGLYKSANAIIGRDFAIVKESFRAANYRRAAGLFHDAGDYQDAREMEQKCLRLAEEADERERAYQYFRALEMKKEARTTKGYERAVQHFEMVSGYSDADAQREECRKLYEKSRNRDNRRKTIVLGVLALLVAGTIWFFRSSAWEQVWHYIKTGTTIERTVSDAQDADSDSQETDTQETQTTTKGSEETV